MRRLDPNLEPPSYAQPGDAGADLRSTEDFVLEPGERRVVGTGLAIALPEGYAAFVHPRSGLAAQFGIGIVNAPGTIDAGYRGEVKVCLINHDASRPVRFSRTRSPCVNAVRWGERSRRWWPVKSSSSVVSAGTGRNSSRCSSQ